MRGKVAKRLRREAEQLTVGKSDAVTRSVYNGLKRKHKARVI